MADVLIARVTGGPEPPPYAGEVICYVEMGNQTIGKVNVNFLAGAPAPPPFSRRHRSKVRRKSAGSPPLADSDGSGSARTGPSMKNATDVQELFFAGHVPLSPP